MHSIATDSKGNLYTTETYTGARVQRFVYKGIGPVTKPAQGVLWPRAASRARQGRAQMKSVLLGSAGAACLVAAVVAAQAQINPTDPQPTCDMCPATTFP